MVTNQFNTNYKVIDTNRMQNQTVKLKKKQQQ